MRHTTLEPTGIYELPHALGASSVILLADDEHCLIECHDTPYGDTNFMQRATAPDSWLEYEVEPDGRLSLIVLEDTQEQDSFIDTGWTINDLKLLGYLRNGSVQQPGSSSSQSGSSQESVAE